MVEVVVGKTQERSNLLFCRGSLRSAYLFQVLLVDGNAIFFSIECPKNSTHFESNTHLVSRIFFQKFIKHLQVSSPVLCVDSQIVYIVIGDNCLYSTRHCPCLEVASSCHEPTLFQSSLFRKAYAARVGLRRGLMGLQPQAHRPK